MTLRRIISLLFCFIGTISLSYAQNWIDVTLVKADSFGSIEQYDSCHNRLDKVVKLYNTSSTKIQSFIRPKYLNALDLKAFYYGEEEKNVLAAKIALQLIDSSKTYGEPQSEGSGHIGLALVYEKMGELIKCRTHLNEAHQLIEKHKLDELIAYHSVRMSSYMRFVQKSDSCRIFAEKAIEYGERYHQLKHFADGHFLLSNYYHNEPLKSTYHLRVAAESFMELGQYYSAAYMYGNISRDFQQNGDYINSLKYSDTTLMLFSKTDQPISSSIQYDRADLLRELGHYDSAYFVLERAAYTQLQEHEREQKSKIADLTILHETERKSQVITQQKELNNIARQRFKRAVIVAIILCIVVVLLFLANRQIRKQNSLIQEKTSQLELIIEQKQTLLHEIHHRLKNNLQMVISMLDIQKHSNKNKTHDEIISESKTRILSMAYLHSHLYENDDYTNIKIKDYIQSIVDLVLQSYRTQGKDFTIDVNSSQNELSIDRSLPVGLIIVELLSNSFKYAFEHVHKPCVWINLTKSQSTKYLFELTYTDNGPGFNSTSDKLVEGLGLKLIQGFVAQLNGVVKFDTNEKLLVTIKFS